ncbi:hypothetical protein [Nostoc sp. ChiSLP03a]|nr:hypothetical protein [Nostoc sp. ChiSLP03a]MDZ8216124.1 hypothetical protein [Nostoc sp. ChiSLP03a]
MTHSIAKSSMMRSQLDRQGCYWVRCAAPLMPPALGTDLQLSQNWG